MKTGLFGAFEATPVASVREVFETNTFGVLAMTQAVLPHFRARRNGVVVNVTSSATLAPMLMVAVYTASKAASKALPPRSRSNSTPSTCGSSWLNRATPRRRALRATGKLGCEG